MDPLQWMGAVRLKVQTADKNITIIQNSSLSINVLWSEKLRVCKKQVYEYIYIFFFNLRFWTKLSIIHNNSSSSGKSPSLAVSHISYFGQVWHVNGAWSVHISLLMKLRRVDYLLIVMFYKLFGLSFWRHPFTAEDPLVSKWCKAEFL